MLIETAQSRCAALTVLVYARPDFVNMPSGLRAGLLRQIYPEIDIRVPADPPPDTADDETQRLYVKQWLAASDLTVDAVFTSEAYGRGFAERLGVVHVEVDSARALVPVRGSAIRRSPKSHRDWLHPLVYKALQDAGDLSIWR